MIRFVLAVLLALSFGANAGVKTAGVGHFQIPTAPAAGTSVTSGAANVYTTNAVQLIASTAAALYITGVYAEEAAVSSATYKSVQLMIGAGGSETVLGQYLISPSTGSTVTRTYRPIYPPIPVASAQRISVKTADSAGGLATLISLEVIAQTNVVDDAIPVTTVTTVTNQLTAAQVATGVWQDATAGDFTTASSIGKSLYTGNVAPGGSGGLMISGTNAGTTTLGALTVTGATTHTGATVYTGNVSYADGITIAAPSTGNRAGLDITGNGTGAALKLAAGATGIGMSVAGGGTSGDGIKVTTTSGHGVNLAPVGTSMHGLFATGGNGGTSDGIKAVAGTGGVALRAATITGDVTGSLSGSVGSVTGAVGSVTGLTASNLDAAVSSRMATYTQPTGFLAATFPGTVASTTNITAGTITTVTTVTNQLTAAQIATGVWQDTTAGDFTTALSVGKSLMNGVSLGTGLTVASVSGAVGSVTGAVGSVTGLTASNLDAAVSSRMATYTQPTGFLAATFPGTVASPTNITAATGITVATNSDKTGYALTASYDAAKTASQAGDAMTLTAAYDSAKTAAPASTALSTATWTSGRATNLDNLDAAISSRSTYAGGDTSGTTTLLSRLTSGRATGLDNLDAAVTTRMATFSLPTNFSALAVTAGGAVTAGTVSDKTGYALTSAYDPAKTAAQAGDSMAINSTGINSIWNEALSGHTTVGSAGKALSDASSGSDPWAITLPGAYGASSAGFIIGTYLDAAISSRAASATALSTAIWTNTRASNIDSIKTKTDSLTFSAPGKVDANAKAINGVTLTGAGTSNNPWGPAP